MGALQVGSSLRRYASFVVVWWWIVVVVSPLACAADVVLNGLTRDDQQISGRLVGDDPQSLRLMKADGQSLTLDQIQSLDLPIKSRSLPHPGWKRARLTTGDVLHVSAAPGPGATKPAPSRWSTGFSQPGDLPQSGIATLTHSPGTRCLLYDDFENGAVAWKNGAGGDVQPSMGRARSGVGSLKCSSETPELRYLTATPLPAGRIEFHVYLDPAAESDGRSRCRLQFSAAKPFEVAFDLVGQESWYEVQTPAVGTWERQAILRRSGWHLVTVTWRAAEIHLAIDGFELAAGRMGREQQVSLTAVEFQYSGAPGAVWIDDFSIADSSTGPISPVLQRDTDQVDLATGDQLFGQVLSVDSRAIRLSVDSQVATLNWGSVTDLHFALRPERPREVSGWMVSIELQPWTNAPELKDADFLRGALLSTTTDGCIVEHPVCGRMTIPWSVIRRVRPLYRGREWVLEGRPRHLGNEVKAAFASPINEGAKLSWSVELPDDLPMSAAFFSLIAQDLEPAGKGTRPNQWLKQLQSGNLTSELRVNEKPIAILNQHITGRGNVSRPQQLRIPILDHGVFQKGKNEVFIHLNPAAGDIIEYDDWELREIRLEIELKQ